MAMCSNDTEGDGSYAMRAANETDVVMSTNTQEARVLASGSTFRRLGLRMPAKMPTFEKSMRTELAEYSPRQIVRAPCWRAGPTPWNYSLACGAHVRVRTLDGLEALHVILLSVSAKDRRTGSCRRSLVRSAQWCLLYRCTYHRPDAMDAHVSSCVQCTGARLFRSHRLPSSDR